MVLFLINTIFFDDPSVGFTKPGSGLLTPFFRKESSRQSHPTDGDGGGKDSGGVTGKRRKARFCWNTKVTFHLLSISQLSTLYYFVLFSGDLLLYFYVSITRYRKL